LRPDPVVHLFYPSVVLRDVEGLQAAAIACAEAALWSLSDTEIVDSLTAVHHADQALRAAKAHLIGQVTTRDIPAQQASTSTASWLRWQLHVSIQEAHRLVTLSTALNTRPDLDHALTAGRINHEQALTVAKTLDDLTGEVTDTTIALAEAHLIGDAATLDPHQLRQAGSRILTHVAPEVAERAELAALQRADARAYRNRHLSLSPIGDGGFRLHGTFDAEAAAIIRAALDPLCSPRTSHGPVNASPGSANDSAAASPMTTASPTTAASPMGADPDDARTADNRSAGQRRADALVDICRLALRTSELPSNGGEPPQVNVLIPYDMLLRDVGQATTDTGEQLTPAQMRQTACDARILPVILGGAGQVLDVGQSRRLFTAALRRALVARDRGCAFPACDRPARWCEGHHIRAWADGGPTSLTNGVLLGIMRPPSQDRA
jgi:hypothetical protein